MRNPYKRLDVFRCNQEAHRHFGGRVSVYHVLKEKGCYPEGCLYFVWHCALMEKGRRCVRGYAYVGRNCPGCNHYLDEKVHLQPRRLLDEEAYGAFLEELEAFETWLESVEYKRVAVAGRVNSVKPWFVEVLGHQGRQFRLKGYILVFRRGFFGTQAFDDTFYVRVSEGQMRQFRFVRGQSVELLGEVRVDRGRVVVNSPKSIEAVPGPQDEAWQRDRALVAVKTATLQEGPPDPCHACRWGALADVEEHEGREVHRSRRFYCLKGVVDPEACYVRMGELLGIGQSAGTEVPTPRRPRRRRGSRRRSRSKSKMSHVG